jgi:hypothetical protein
MIIETEHFNPTTDPKLLCTCGHEDCDKRSVKRYFLNMLELVRIDYGFSMVVTSGGRCPYHPNEIHRSEPADHQKQLGIDIKITGLIMAMKLMAIGARHGFNSFGINLISGFIHIGHRPGNGNKISVWTY